MKTPNAKDHDPRPGYLRALLAQAGLSQEGAALLIGIGARTMRNYLDDKDKRNAPYSIQFALECLARAHMASRQTIHELNARKEQRTRHLTDLKSLFPGPINGPQPRKTKE